MSLSILIFALVLISSTYAITKVGVQVGDVNKDKGSDYGVVIDLGSKGSRVSVFTWPSDASIPYTEVAFGGGKNPWYSKITPGIATFASNPAGAGPYLKPLLDYAYSTVPSTQFQTTPIFVRGTDNLRQLPGGQAQEIMNSISNYTASNYKFLMTPNCVSLLPGILEAGFMWVAANYLQQNFQKSDSLTGTLDMGSGSTQIAFMPKTGTVIPTNYYYLFTYDKSYYAPYAHSYTGYGYVASLYAVNNSVVSQQAGNVVYNPCFLAGYSTAYSTGDRQVTMLGTGSWAQCSALTYEHLNATAACPYQPCSFDGAFLPALHGNFLAVSNYVDVANILGFSGSATVQELIDGGIHFCSLSWSEAQEQNPDEDPADLATYCFGANYITTLLTKGYTFDLSTSIDFSKSEDNAPYTWALGAMIYELQMGW